MNLRRECPTHAARARFAARFMLAFAAKFFSSTAYGALNATLAAYAMAQLATGSAQAGLAVGVFTIGSLCARPLAGWLVGRVGAQRLLALSCAAFCAAAGLYFAPVGFEGLVAVRLAHGFAFGFIHNTMTVVVAGLLPPQRLGMGMGVFSLSATLATAAGPALGITLQRGASPDVLFAVVWAITGAALAAAGALLLLSCGHTGRGDGSGADSAPTGRLSASNPMKAWFEPRVAGVACLSTVACMGYAGIVAFLSPYAQQLGLGEWAAWYFAAYPVVLAVLRPAVGHVLDRGVFRAVAAPALGVFAVGLALLAFCSGTVMLFASAICVIVGYGGAFFVLQTIAVKTAPEGRLGQATGTFGVLSDSGMAAGPLLMGVAQAALGYTGMYALCALAVAIAAAVAFIVVPRRG